MSTNVKRVSDKVSSRDGFRTEILVGYDVYKDAQGISQLGEEIIEREHNKIVAGGLLKLLSMMFDVKSDLTIQTLNTIMGVGLDGTVNTGSKYKTLLFNIGLGGCGSAYTDKKAVLDQQNIVSEMIPFRVVDDAEAIGADKGKYWFAKEMPDGKIGYYLKTFESKPTCISLWKDAESPEDDGTRVTGDPSVSSRTEGMEHLVEIILNISATDLREYFQLYDPTSTEYARFNSIGLCMGELGTLSDGIEEYLNVEQFSILNFSNEMLHFNKDLSIIYRVYIS